MPVGKDVLQMFYLIKQLYDFSLEMSTNNVLTIDPMPSCFDSFIHNRVINKLVIGLN